MKGCTVLYIEPFNDIISVDIDTIIPFQTIATLAPRTSDAHFKRLYRLIILLSPAPTEESASALFNIPSEGTSTMSYSPPFEILQNPMH